MDPRICGDDDRRRMVLAKRMTQPVTKLTPEMLIPRLGESLVQKGVLSETDLQTALAYQQDQMANNRTYLLGQALLDLKLVDRETLDQVITEQILQLRS